MPANETQIGGTHYKDMAVQPWDYMRECMSAEAFTGYLQGCCIKYLSRFHKKGGVEDLRKARHYLDRLIETLDPPFAVTLDKAVRDSLLHKYKDGVPAVEAAPPGFRDGYRAMWGINAIVEPTHYSGLGPTGAAPIFTRTDGPGIPGAVTYVCPGESLDEAAKRAAVKAANTRDNTSPAVMTFADGGVVGIEVWPGPDWSQAPDWAMWWCRSPGENKAKWHRTEPHLMSIDGRQGWEFFCLGGNNDDAPLFGYTGDWRDSLRKRPDFTGVDWTQAPLNAKVWIYCDPCQMGRNCWWATGTHGDRILNPAPSFGYAGGPITIQRPISTPAHPSSHKYV